MTDGAFKKVSKPTAKPEIEKTKLTKHIDLLKAQKKLGVNIQPRVIQPQRKPVVPPSATEAQIKREG